MHECLLCERDMKRSKKLFGDACVKKLYAFLNIERPKKLRNQENILIKNTMVKEGIIKLNSNQKEWFIDRYITREYLERLHYADFEKLKEQITKEIKNIDKTDSIKNIKTLKEIKLKDVYSLYKKQEKFDKYIKKIKKNDFKDIDELKLLLASCSFIFNLSRYKNQYEKNMFNKMQYVFWQTVIEVGGKYANFETAAFFLQHSLEEEASNLEIRDGKIIEIIKKDECFKDKLNEILEKYSNKDYINIPLEEESLIFENSDLYFGINKAKISIKGIKTNNKWDLNIHLNDTYDYTQFKNFEEYYNDTNTIQKSIFSSTLYNLAFFSMKFNVMKKYEIDIYFNIDGYEVV